MREKADSFWALALVLCVILSVFALFFASCTRQETEEKPSSGGFSVETEAPGEETAEPPQETDAAPPAGNV